MNLSYGTTLRLMIWINKIFTCKTNKAAMVNIFDIHVFEVTQSASSHAIEEL